MYLVTPSGRHGDVRNLPHSHKLEFLWFASELSISVLALHDLAVLLRVVIPHRGTVLSALRIVVLRREFTRRADYLEFAIMHIVKTKAS